MLPLKAHVQVRLAKRELQKAQEFQRRYADQRRRPTSLVKGQQVWLSTAHTQMEGVAEAFKNPFAGPYEILETTGPNAARLMLPKSMTVHPVFHVSLLAPSVPEPDHLGRDPIEQEPVGEGGYVIDATFNHQLRGGRMLYQVK